MSLGLILPGRSLQYGNLINRQSPLAAGLAGFWPVLPQTMGGARLLDAYGTNHGTLTNGPTWSGLAPPGGFGSLGFDGTDDAVLITPISLSADFILDIWFNGSDFHLTNRILWGCSTEVLTFIGFLGSNTTVYYRSPASTLLSFTVPAILLDAWHHLVVTRTGNSIRVFVDGVESSSGAQNDSSTPAYVIDLIGSYPTTSLGWSGYLSHVSIHNVAWDISYVRAWYGESRLGYPPLLNRSRNRFFFRPAAGTCFPILAQAA